ncbi:hypothetical protein LLEC1_03343, partial [Akanthomyces lecanii]
HDLPGKAHLVPGAAAALIPASFAPSAELSVSFGDAPVQLGNLMRVSQVQPKPAFSFQLEAGAGAASDSSSSFLMMLIDPDAPTPEDPKFASSPHRYLFLLFREPAGLALHKSDLGGEAFIERRSFDAAAFVARHGLQLVGVNWMLCAADEWSA